MRSCFTSILLCCWCWCAGAAITETLGNDVNLVGVAGYYDATRTNANSPLWLFVHGYGGSRTSPMSDSWSNHVQAIITNQGAIFVATDAQSNNGFGSPTERRDYSNAVIWAQQTFPTAGLRCVYAVSMGGCTGGYFATNTAVTHAIFIYPIIDLEWAYKGTGAGTAYTAVINTAYGASVWGDIPSGHDPSKFAVGQWAGKRTLWFHSPADTGVDYNTNSVYMTSRLPSSRLVTTSGDHGDASNFDASTVAIILQFLATGQSVPTAGRSIGVFSR